MASGVPESALLRGHCGARAPCAKVSDDTSSMFLSIAAYFKVAGANSRTRARRGWPCRTWTPLLPPALALHICDSDPADQVVALGVPHRLRARRHRNSCLVGELMEGSGDLWVHQAKQAFRWARVRTRLGNSGRRRMKLSSTSLVLLLPPTPTAQARGTPHFLACLLWVVLLKVFSSSASPGRKGSPNGCETSRANPGRGGNRRSECAAPRRP